MKNKIIMMSLVILALTANVAFAATPLDKNVPAKLKCTVDAANVRSGPSTDFMKVDTLKKNQIVDCIGKIGNKYLIKCGSNCVGYVDSSCAKAYSGQTTTPKATPKPTTPAPTTPAPTTPAPTPAPPTATAPPSNTPTDTGLDANEQEMFNLVNKERTSRGIPALKVDPQLVKTARLKSQDMVDKNYFAHQSPTYGSPFDMMKKFGITYKSAGENLAANSSVAAAHTALMNSQGHRENILNTSYNYIGIGIVSSSQYGLMFTQQFIGK